ncbi:hypothetical protein BLOT_000269 [Blomia tropicalis]|nr:hypothetical protein BLOT_000269 [Blomia tropicalis]
MLRLKIERCDNDILNIFLNHLQLRTDVTKRCNGTFVRDLSYDRLIRSKIKKEKKRTEQKSKKKHYDSFELRNLVKNCQTRVCGLV